MKEVFLQLSAYNSWANQLLLDAINQLPEAQHTQEVPSSFNSLLKTVVHMWDAESIWWQRMRLVERAEAPSARFNGTMKEAAAGLLQQNWQWNEWIVSAQEHRLQHTFLYQNTKREQFKQPVFQVLLQVFNHGSYHRGQLVTMLRQLGVSSVPQTDFIAWCRKR